MKIQIEKTGSKYQANLVDLPGSPPVGCAETPEKAVADLFWRIFHPTNRNNFVGYIDFNDMAEIVYLENQDTKHVCFSCGCIWFGTNPLCPNPSCNSKRG